MTNPSLNASVLCGVSGPAGASTVRCRSTGSRGPPIAVLNAEHAVTRTRLQTARLISRPTLLFSVCALLSISACRQGIPVIDPGPGPAVADGTISGTVRGPAGSSSVEGRTVAVVNVETGVRESATTNSAGGFTFKVKPGKYRVELTLLEGETLVKQPGVINVNRSDVDAHADFVIGTSRIARPRFAAPRVDNGLGAPIA
jgi:hypothetical protein